VSFPIVPGRRYSPQEIARLRQLYPNLTMPGYALRVDVDGYTTVVPWRQASGGGGAFGETPLPGREYGGVIDMPDPIRKRTPNQRLDSLTEKVGPALMNGMGLKADQWHEFVDASEAQAIKNGRRMPSAEDVKAVAAEFLRRAEAQQKEADSKHVTTPSRK